MRIVMLVCAMGMTMTGCDDAEAKKKNPPATPDKPPAAHKSDGTPVEFSFTQPAAGKKEFQYKIKVTGDKPIEQVDIRTFFLDDKGKKVSETTTLWQNIVPGGKRAPIERGKTYEDEGVLEDGSTKVDMKLDRVVFKDKTSWSAP